MAHPDSPLCPADLHGPAAAGVWADLVARHGPRLERLARARGFQAADAADLAQQAFLGAWEALVRLEADAADIGPVLRAALANAVRARAARDRPSGTLETLSAGPDGMGDTFRLSRVPRRRVRLVKLLRRLQWEFERDTWRAFWETAALRRPVRLVAREMGWKATDVAVARYRVRQRLRALVRRMRRG